ncbi:MAG TPA: host attachment protein [Methylococcaceae bacterium]|jgi:protein required for attachment to host cells|nr:host attachment protein [Methylococcaceae bacterium]
MNKTWVVTAESSRARIFAVENRISPLRELEDIAHAEGRSREQDMVSDRPGRAVDKTGENRHAMDRLVDPKRHEAEVFAKRIAERLERARAKGECEQLVLIAAPEFLGVLRQNLTANTAKLVGKTIDKNLVQKTEAEIRQYLFE